MMKLWTVLVSTALLFGAAAGASLPEDLQNGESAAVAQRGLQSSCGLAEGNFSIQATYLGDAGTFNIATRPLGIDADEPEEYHLEPNDEDLSGGVDFVGCFPRNKLHRFTVYVEAPMEGEITSGEYALKVNGETIADEELEESIGDEGSVTFYEYYFVGDEVDCPPGKDRFLLRILFDDWPSEIRWELENLAFEGGKVPLSYEVSLKAGSMSYTDEFKGKVLLVDQCVEASDTYEFTIYDQDGIFSPGFYQISFAGKVLRQGASFEGGSETTTFNSKGIVPTPAPIIVPPAMPFPSLFQPTLVIFTPPPSPEPTPLPVSNIAPSTPAPFKISFAPQSTGENEKPASSPTPVSFPEPPPEESFVSICFSGSTAVNVRDKGRVEMKNLQLGDEIEVSSGFYEAVYSFGHYDLKGQAEMLEIRTDQATLQLSPTHLVFASVNHMENVAAVPAASLEISDRLVFRDTAAVVKSIRTVYVSDGLFAPFTPSGKLLVNDGLSVSSFVGFSETSSSLTIFDSVEISYQWLAHSFEFPHRVVCSYMHQCTSESYSDGLSTWVAGPLELTSWVLNLESTLLKSFIWMVVLVVLSLFSVLDLVLCNAALVLTGLALVLSRKLTSITAKVT